MVLVTYVRAISKFFENHKKIADILSYLDVYSSYRSDCVSNDFPYYV